MVKPAILPRPCIFFLGLSLSLVNFSFLRYAVIWTGDNTGSWEYIRMQIPTIIGSGLSGFAHATGDVDGSLVQAS